MLALPQIVSECPSVRVVFVGVSNTAFSADNALVQKLYRQAAEPNRPVPLIFFEPPLPYSQRGRMYVDADIAVCLFERSLETELSFRTRLVDILWGGVPVVTSRGSGLAQLIEETESGVTLETLDPAELTDAVVGLVQDPGRRKQMGLNARRCVIDHLCWDDLVEPLHRFCVQPRLAVDDDGLSRQFALSAYGGLDRAIRNAVLRAKRKMLTLREKSGLFFRLSPARRDKRTQDGILAFPLADWST